jgi:hypothetical protein
VTSQIIVTGRPQKGSSGKNMSGMQITLVLKVENGGSGAFIP